VNCHVRPNVIVNELWH